jgi:AhpD family alkylhydroperoxidase
MKRRFDISKASPDAYQAMVGLERHIARCGLDKGLIHLVKMRVSQINGCGFCLDMHSKDARAHGETEQRLYLLNAWRESPQYTPKERAALAWAESLTNIARTGVPDADYELAKSQFDDKELADLTLLVVAINGWNRIAVGSRTEPGSYQPPARAAH